MFSTRIKIGLLVAVHLVAAVALAWLTFDQLRWPMPPAYTWLHRSMMGLIHAQAGLLAIWAALGTGRPAWRILAAVGGWTSLAALVLRPSALGWSSGPLLLLPFPAQIVLPAVLVFLLLRRTSVSVQVSIRSWFIATAVFGVLLAMRAITAWRFVLDSVVVDGPCLVLIDLAAFGSGFAARRPSLRFVGLLPVFAGIGLIPLCIWSPTAQWDWELSTYKPVEFGIVGAVTTASLLVIRSCGYRLVRGADEVAASPSAQRLHLQPHDAIE